MMKYFLMTLLLGLGIVLPCQAGLFARPCAHCGCCQLKKVCRMVPDVKKVTVVEYVVEENDFCLFGKSSVEEVMVSDECSPTGQRCETVQVPRCGRVVFQKKLKKKTKTVDKAGFKCLVETVCTQCGGVCDSGNCVQ